MTKVTLSNATLRRLMVGGKIYVRFPLGQTTFTNPTTPANDGSYTSYHEGEWEFEYDEKKTVRDSSSPAVIFVDYVGGRPTGR